jgi:putative DNA primase/helicase
LHRLCPFGSKKVPVMVALVRDILTDAPQAVHRTALSLDGHKVMIDGKDASPSARSRAVR